MLIGELARQSGFPRETIRYYEKIGLLEDRHRLRRANNYKDYSKQALQRLQAVDRLKDHGFSLSEIRDLLPLIEDIDDCRGIPELLDKKLRDTEKRISDLQRARDRLSRAIASCRGADCHPENTD